MKLTQHGCSLDNAVKITLVPPSMVKEARPIVEKLLEGVTFTEPMLYTIDDLFQELEMNLKNLWLLSEFDEYFLFGVTKLAQYPQGKMCVISPLAGRRISKALPLLPKVEQWAKWQDCVCVHAQVGSKLMRILKPHGYVATGFAIYKSLITLQ